MCNFLIGGKTGASRSLAAYLSDHNSLSRPMFPRPLSVLRRNPIPPCVFAAGSSSNHHNHFNLHSKREDFAWPQQ
jgi:hypothetical protein